MFNSSARPPPRRATLARGPRASLFPTEGGGQATPTRGPRPSSALARVRSSSPAGSSTGTPRAGASGDDWDKESKTCWSRDERHAVFSSSALPTEVAQLVHGADFIVNSVAAQLDPVSGFALVSSPSRCVAWNYAKPTHSSPTVYTFPAPQPTRSHLSAVPPSLAAFFGGGAHSEPGLVLVSATGEVRFWESMSLALANVARYQALPLSLGSDDFAERIWKLDTNTFVVTTTSSAAFLIRIAPVGGRLVPSVTPFTRAGGLFGRSSTVIFQDRRERGGIVAVAPTANGVYLLGKTTLQKWFIGPDGSVKMAMEMDLHDSIGPILFEERWETGNIHLELNDLVSVGPDHLAALLSYSQQDPGSSEYQHVHQAHAVVVFEYKAQSHSIVVGTSTYISYLAHPDPRMLDVPRLFIAPGSKTAFIRFADAIVMASLSSTPYEDAIRLKDSNRNAFIGVGTVPSIAATVSANRTASLVAMSAIGGVMTVEVHETATPSRKLSSQASATAAIKSKIEQAVFFGDRGENPLTFDLAPGFQGDLAEAAEAVSTQIVASSSPYMPEILETRVQLQYRLNRLKELMNFIHRNGALSLLGERARRTLSSHAEKIKSAMDLWDHQDKLMDKLNTCSPESLLADSIATLMQELGGGAAEDVVRDFFRRHVMVIDRLLETVYASYRSAGSRKGDQSDWLLEANRIFQAVYRSSARFRRAEAATYQDDAARPNIELWTAADALLGDVEALYGATERTIAQRTRTIGSVVDETPAPHSETDLSKQQHIQTELKDQMASLAASLCDNMEDKLRTAAQQVGNGADADAGLALSHRWEEMKPRIIRPLVDVDCVQQAYELAEHHCDFATLVYLCHNKKSSAGPEQIEHYIEKFGAEFAFVLYDWYIEQGDLHALLNQDEVYGELLTEFFRLHPHPELAWVHDIASQQFAQAATALIAVEGETASLAEKQLMSSIAKLTAVAFEKMHGPTTDGEAILNRIDDELEMINSQEVVLDEITTTGKGGKAPSPAQYVAQQASHLSDRPAFKRVLETEIATLLQGDALDTEAFVDVMTLKDTIGAGAAVALERLARDVFLPEGRKQVALLSLWRRVFVRDDWTAIANTAGRSEEKQRDVLRATATYTTLQAIGETDLPASFILTPAGALAPPLGVEIAARFPSLPPSEVEALMKDHEAEIEVLGGLIKEVGLEQRVRGVRALVLRDAQEEQQVDVEMA